MTNSTMTFKLFHEYWEEVSPTIARSLALCNNPHLSLATIELWSTRCTAIQFNDALSEASTYDACL
jgi:hypothetical protein